MKDTLEFSLAPDAFARAAIHQGRRVVSPWLRRLIALLSCLAFAAMGALLPLSWDHDSVPATIVLYASLGAVLFGIAASMLQSMAVQRAYRGSTYAARRRNMRVDERGLYIFSERSELWHDWAEIESAELVGDVMMIRLDPIFFHAVPIAAFESKPEAEAFVALVNERARNSSAAGAGIAVAPPAPAAPATPSTGSRPSAVRSLGGAVGDALRLAFLMAPKDGRPAGSWGAILLLILISVGWPTLFSLPMIGLSGELNIYSLPDASVHIALILAASIAAALAIGRPTEVGRVFAAGLLISIILDGVLFAVSRTSREIYMLLFVSLPWLFPAWLMLALGTFAARQVEPGVRRLGALAACVLLLIPMTTMVYRDRTLWHTPYNEDAVSAGPRNGAGTEEIFYRQPTLLAQSLEAIQPGQKGVIDVFFVALGGYANQDVFRREVDATSRLMAERFGAEGHSIRLVNNQATLHDIPIASKTSLRAALNRIAGVMDKEEDVLVLFMTSHGSVKHIFTLQLWPMQFEDLDPAAVRQLLDESGIRNRVVIVSACYSGGFTKPLEDANTLVITAAAKDKTSFGCTNEAEWTYFGKAYFDEALRSTHSFVRAFEIAKPVILERESKVRTEASDPQISIGSHIATVLEALEKQLEGITVTVDDSAKAPAVARVAAAKDKYNEYVNLVFSADYLEEIVRTCRANMAQSSPEATVRKRPGAFGGMEKESPEHWKRVVSAWSTYTEKFCTTANDRTWVRDTYAQKVRTVLSGEDVDAAVGFLSTGPGAKWWRAEQEVFRQQSLELTRRQGDLAERLYREYLAAETAAAEAYRNTKR